MRARTFVFLAGVVAGAYLYYSGKGREWVDRIREATAEQTASDQETEKEPARRERTRRSEPARTEAKAGAAKRTETQAIDHSNDDLPTMLDDVAHRDDIPNTPVKAAFEAAVHDQAHH